MYIWIWVALAVCAADQLSKLLIAANFGVSDRLAVIPGVIDFVYVENTGAAFSLLSSHTWLLGVVSALFCAAIAAYMAKMKFTDKRYVIIGGMLLGGALGNGIDRIFRGYVVDFIEFAFVRFPVFNIADIAITVGAALLVGLVILQKEKA